MHLEPLAFLMLAPLLGAARTAGRSNPVFERLSDAFMKESLALSPVSASNAGYHVHHDARTGAARALDAELDDLSPEGAQVQRRFYAEWNERFRREVPRAALDAEDAADWELIQDQIALALLELDRIESYRHNPTVAVELLGNALFLPLSQSYAPGEVRLGHVVTRIGLIPRALEQAKRSLLDSDPVFVAVAVQENAGNVSLVRDTVGAAVRPGTPLRDAYEKNAAAAIAALEGFSRWLEEDLGKRPPTRTWRLGPELYAEKFRLVMEAPVTPDQVLADARREMADVRAEMLGLAEPLHRSMYPDHAGHHDVAGRERENLVIGEVLARIADEHPKPDALLEHVKADLEGITAFIREKRIVGLSDRDNLRVVPTPEFLRGIFSVAGFHAPPPLEPHAEAQYWVTPIDPGTPSAKAESKLREYNDQVLKWLTIHEALPGHYVQFEHANGVQPERRRLLRALFGNGPYVEGWAEYVAQVMMDAGFAGGDPRFRLSMRKIRLRVLANAILDVELHTRGMGDRGALELMTGEAFQTQAEAEGKLQRAKLSSAQLPTYYVGLRDWLALRRKYEAARGADFDMLEFHDRVLDEGPIALRLLEAIVLAR